MTTPVICKDGKRHYWKGKETGTAICNKCGWITEYVYNPLRKNPWIRCKNLKGNYIFKEI